MNRLVSLLLVLSFGAQVACRPPSPDEDAEGSTEAHIDSDETAAVVSAPSTDTDGSGTGAEIVSAGEPDPHNAGGELADTPDESATATPTDNVVERARATADLTIPLTRMPPGASLAVVIDLGALRAATAEMPVLSVDAGLDAALGGALARVVGADAIAARLRAPEDGVLTIGAWGDTGDDFSWFGPAEMLSTPPADGGSAASIADGVRAARRGATVGVGRGYGVSAFAGDAAGGLDVEAIAGPAGAMPWADSVVAGWWDAEAVDETLPGIGASVDGVALAADADGTVRLALSTNDRDATLAALGRGQAWTSMALGQWRRDAPTDASAAVALVARYVDLAWSRLTVTPHEGYIVVRIAAPDCGGPLRNIPLIAMLIGVIEVAANDEAAPALPFTSTRVDTVDCGAVGGPAPALNRELSRLAPARSDAGLVVLADLGAIVRHVSPDGAGLLPAALPFDVIDAAVGGRPFGLDGLDDTNGQIAAWFEAASGHGERALVLPRGVADLDGVQRAGPGATIGNMVLNAVVPGGLLFATRATPATTRLDDDAPHPWVDAAARLPNDTLAALLIPASLVEPWLARLPQGDGAAFEAALRDADVMAVAWTGSRGPVLVFGPGVDGIAVRAALPTAFTTGVAAIGRYGRMSPEDAAALTARLDLLTRGMTIEADDMRTLIVFDGGGLSLLATTLTVALPAVGAAIQNPGFDLPPVSPQLIYDATQRQRP